MALFQSIIHENGGVFFLFIGGKNAKKVTSFLFVCCNFILF